MAKAARVGQSTIYEIERGDGFAKRQMDKKVRIAKALGRDVFELEQIEASFAGQGPVERPQAIIVDAQTFWRLEHLASARGVTIPTYLQEHALANTRSVIIKRPTPQPEPAQTRGVKRAAEASQPS